MPRPRLSILAVLCLLLVPPGTLLHGAEPLLQIGDTFVASENGNWTIGNGLVRYQIGQVSGGIGVRSIADPVSPREWNRGTAADSFVTVNGQRVNIGTSPTQFVTAAVSEWWGGVKLDVRYRLPSASLIITRSYACYPDSAVIESWTTFTQEGTRTTTLSDLTDYSLSIESGTVRWITGLNTPPESGGSFTRMEGTLADGQSFDLGSYGRASEQALPFFSVRSGTQEFFGSIIWSGAWRFHAQRAGAVINVQLGLPAFQTSLAPGASLEMPHAVLGVTNAVVPSTAVALRSFIDLAIRHGRPMSSYISYNTWYSYGTFVDEPSMLAEMQTAASMGIEQFVVDAGWWRNIDPDSSSNFSSSWGGWEVDPERFPNGLGALSDRAHELGMRFGVWVEPERVALNMVGGEGQATERFLATSDGRYDPSTSNASAESAQVCLADPNARAWLVDKLLTFIADARPDYLKWDNNFWINCNRAGHGHGAQDGNFRHHFGLQSVLDQVRATFPDPAIENCASGGNRLSLDMLARTDAGWVDDRTDPSVHVRHDLEGLVDLLPSPYLLTFAVGPIEASDNVQTADVAYVLRSRMLGTVGLSWLMGGMEEGTRREIGKQIALFQRLRPILAGSAGTLLTPQAVELPGQPWSGWDAVQYLSSDRQSVVVLAFDTADGPPEALLRLKGLLPNAIYSVESADYGDLGSATGADLMLDGLQLETSGLSLSHTLILRAR